MNNYLKGHAGYTLIEVSIAMGIFAIGFLAVARMQIQGVNITTSARVITEALELAEAQVEYFHALPFYPNFTDTILSSQKRFASPAPLNEGEQKRTINRFTIKSVIKDDDPLESIENIYTHTPDPSEITISKTITVVVYETRNPDKVLAVLEMIRVWEVDL